MSAEPEHFDCELIKAADRGEGITYKQLREENFRVPALRVLMIARGLRGYSRKKEDACLHALVSYWKDVADDETESDNDETGNDNDETETDNGNGSDNDETESDETESDENDENKSDNKNTCRGK